MGGNSLWSCLCSCRGFGAHPASVTNPASGTSQACCCQSSCWLPECRVHLMVPGDPWKRRYIYNQALCGRCGSKVATWEMAARRVYACQTCQPLSEDTVISPARTKALAASTPTRVPVLPMLLPPRAAGSHATFIACLQSRHRSDDQQWRLLTLECGRVPSQKFLSHCAPDDPTTMAPQQMSMALLRAALKARGLKAAGNKAALVAELTAARAAETAGDAAGPAAGAICCPA